MSIQFVFISSNLKTNNNKNISVQPDTYQESIHDAVFTQLDSWAAKAVNPKDKV